METKRKGEAGNYSPAQGPVVEVVITPTPEEQQENRIVSSLLNRTLLSESEIRAQYCSFMSVCPDGLMTKTKFLELSQVIFSHTVNNYHF